MARCAKLFICFFLTILSFNQFLVVCDGTIAAQESSWKMIGPGDANQAKNLSVMDDGTVFLGTDIGGIYRSTNYGELLGTIKCRHKKLQYYNSCNPGTK
jgi:hypothetical protein